MTRELHHFLLLPRDQQIEAIRRLRTMGWSDDAIAKATGLSAVQVRDVLGQPAANPTRCPKSGVPMSACTCSAHEVAP
jgi:hypothetical protein